MRLWWEIVSEVEENRDKEKTKEDLVKEMATVTDKGSLMLLIAKSAGMGSL